ncbi:unnamed protein product, partial [Brachionus calyciflorus]
PDLKGAIDGVFDKIEKHKDKQFSEIKTELERLEKENSGEKDKSLSERIDLLSESTFKYELKIKYLEYVKLDTKDPNKIKEAEKQKDLAETKLKKEKENLATMKDRVNLVVNIVETGKLVREVYDDFRAAEDEMAIMDKAITSNVENFKNLHELEDTMVSFQNGIVKNLHNQLNDIGKNLKGSSLASMELTRWKTQRTLKELSEIFMQTLSSFGNTTQLITTIKRIDESFSTMLNIYTKIESYMEQNDFATYISDITKQEIEVGIPIKYQSKINQLKKMIHSNVIMDRYQQAIDAFNYWSFPFFCQYTSDLVIYDTKQNNFLNTDEMIINYANLLSNLLNKLKNFETLVRPSIDNNIQGFSFENEFSFYKWSSVNYPFEFKQFLSGKKTIFDADLDSENGKLFDVIKFCTIYLTIEVKNSTKNEQLKNLLKNYFVELTHSGVSNYRYKNKKFTIDLNFNSGEKLKLRYQYGSTDTSNANESFKKLSINKPILSPYTLWNIQLVPINIQKHFQLLNDLQSLTNNEEVFVSLNGKGQYIVSDQFQFDPETCPTNHDLNNQFYISQIQPTGPTIGQWRSIENSRQSGISQESNQQNGSISSDNQESNKRKRGHKRLLRYHELNNPNSLLPIISGGLARTFAVTAVRADLKSTG